MKDQSSYTSICKLGLKKLSLAYGISTEDLIIDWNIFFRAPGFLGTEDLAIPASVLTPAKSIFAHLNTDRPKSVIFPHPQAFRLSSTFFRYEPLDDKVIELQKQGLEKDLAVVLSADQKSFPGLALELLYRYGSTVAVSEKQPQASLYEAVKIGSALEACLADGEASVCLVGGGFSGIQDYIYTVVSKNASKSLKGRSFYLQLMADAVVDYILTELDLNDFHILYTSGGGFMILAPDSAKEKIKEIFDVINIFLFEQFSGQLFVTLDHQIVPANELSGSRFPMHAAKLFQKLDQQKRQKHMAAILKSPDAFFSKLDNAGLWQRDAITQEELPTGKNGKSFGYPLDKFAEEELAAVEELIGPVTHLQIELGRLLKHLKSIATGPKGFNPKGAFQVNPGFGKTYFQIFSKKPGKSDLGAEKQNYKLFEINQPETPMRSGVFLRLYGGNETPMMKTADKKELPMSFNEMAGQGRFKRLGILRMDVDNLGTFIANKVENLIDLATLSRALDQFFKGFLNTLWKEEHKTPENRKGYAQSSAIIYSGGDDLFIIGRWDLMTNLAQEIHAAFRHWTAYNPDFTLSAGLAVIESKYPVMRGAQIAKELEKMAKEHQFQLQKKNAVTFLGQPMNWDNEFGFVKKLKEEVLSFVQATNNRSLFTRIAGLSKLKQQTDGKPGPWHWKLSYAMYRVKENIPKSKTNLRKQVEKWSAACLTNHWDGRDLDEIDFLKMFALASRWAELEYRTKTE